MSERKSWDVQRKPAGSPTTPVRRMEMVRRPSPSVRAAPPRAVPPPIEAPRPRRPVAPARPRAEKSPSLKQRRKEKRTANRILLGITSVVVCAALLYTVWLPALRVDTVKAEGPDPDGISRIAKEVLAGNRFIVLPANSIFVIPEDRIRARVMEAYPSVQAVSISALGLDSLSVKALTRASAFTWCGESVDMPAPTCYQADAEGLIFQEAVRSAPATTTASSTVPASPTPAVGDEGSLLIYGALEGAGESPIRAHVTYASALPEALRFVKAMRSLGADIVSVNLRGDEVDLYTRAGSRITYVIGREVEAATLAATALPTLNVNDGSIIYVDLRFQNKVYLKRRGE